MWNEHSPFYEPVPYTSMVELFLKELKQLDEPEKVKVPQFMADWIDYFKKNGDWDLFQAMDYLFGKKEIREWLEYKNNQDLFARAWLDGYEVEKEKRYLVTLKNRQPLVKSQSGSTLYFSQDITARNYKGTQKELEDAKFGWVFDCPGIEIEEVE
ncbi:phage protein [Streptococcus pneumoniae]|nr:phage protein [Streptococcus pneumoniae]VRZ18768.1 phage protein [Streptococcus pneumoniae]